MLSGVQPSVTQWTVASVCGVLQQQYCRGLLCPPPGGSGPELGLLRAGGLFAVRVCGAPSMLAAEAGISAQRAAGENGATSSSSAPPHKLPQPSRNWQLGQACGWRIGQGRSLGCWSSGEELLEL